MPVYVVCLMNFMPKDNSVTKFRTDVGLYEKEVKMSFPTIFTSSTYLFLSLTRRQKNVKVILTNGFMY